MMQVFIEKTNETQEISFEGSARELCDHLKVNIEEVLIVKDGVLLTPDDLVSDAKEIKLLSVISGG